MLTNNLTPNPFPIREGEQENRAFKTSLSALDKAFQPPFPIRDGGQGG
jgi:hypothetical protein